MTPTALPRPLRALPRERRAGALFRGSGGPADESAVLDDEIAQAIAPLAAGVYAGSEAGRH